MQTPLIVHYLSEALENWLKELSKKFPMSPMSSVLSNYLHMSDDGSEVTRLKIAAAQFYATAKTFEAIPDELAYAPEATIGGALDDSLKYSQEITTAKVTDMANGGKTYDGSFT